jgi:large repetitive protein
VRADVTKEIAAAVLTTRARRARPGRRAQKTLTVTVADVQAGKGYNRHAGWTLLVAWETATGAWRNLTLYDGFAYVQVQGNEQKVVGPLDFTGFETPADGAVDAHVATWTYEGDRSITGDYLALGRLGRTCGELTHMHDALNPAKPPDKDDNFFNGTISTGGVDLGGRFPQFANQLGFDRDRLSVPEGTIGNGARGASVCLGTNGDTYFFGGIAFDALIGAPNLRIAKTASKQTANPGETVTYTTEVANERPAGGAATETATNVVVKDPLPSGLDFVDFSDSHGGACTYDSAARVVTCIVGSLAPGESFEFSYRATVSAAAQGTSPAALVNVACYVANSARQPDTEFRGCDPADVVVPPNPYVDLGVVKRVSADVVAPGATLTWTMVATNHGPSTSTGFVVADALPPGVAFVSHTASAPLTCTTPLPGASGALVCTAPSVPAEPAAGSSLTVTITATVPAATANGTVLRNVVTVNGDQPEPTPDPHPNRDTAVTTVTTDDPPPEPPTPAPPDPDGPPAPPVPPAGGGVLPAGALGTRLSLSKRADTTTVTPGEKITYRLRVANVGEAGAVDVRVCDPLPGGLRVLRARGFHRQSGGLCRNVGRLAIGATRVLRITTRATRSAPRSITNTAIAGAVNARRVRARATVGTFAPCAAAARRPRDDPVAHAAC